MQVLKKEIQESIVNAAAQLFYNQGFEETSTRQIAAEVQISVSNLYKYFTNKEDIFNEVVREYYTSYLANFRKFVSHKDEDTFDAGGNATLAQALFTSIKTEHKKFVILMDKSRGTKYAGFKDEIVTLLYKHILKNIGESGRQEYIIKVLVSNFFQGIVEIARNYRNDKWAQKNIDLLVKYHMNGIASLYD